MGKVDYLVEDIVGDKEDDWESIEEVRLLSKGRIVRRYEYYIGRYGIVDFVVKK